MKLIRSKRRHDVTFCDRCSSVCDARCRSNAMRESSQDRVLEHGFRI
jgi:hypothetical protein